MSKRKPTRTPTRTTATRPFTPEEQQEILARAVARWRGIPDPPETKVIELTFGDAPPVSAAERQSGIRLHRRLIHFEHVSRHIVANPESTPGRRRRAAILLRETLDARARWASGERPDARMGDLERIAGVLDALTLLPLAGHGHAMGKGKPKGSRNALGRVVAAYLKQAPAEARTFEAVWEHLRTRAAKDDDTIQEVLDDRVDWLDAAGRPQATSAKRVKNLIGEFRKA